MSMSKVYFISDYHFAHAKVIEFEDRLRARVLGVDTIQEHDEVLKERTLSTVNKRDTLWILGDNGDPETLYQLLKECKSKYINLIPGNHDSKTAIKLWSQIEEVSICGIVSHKGYWHTHAPVHPQELRGKKNIHGHNHSKVIRDPNYICVSVENTQGYPVWGEDIKSGKFVTHNNFTS